MRSPTPHRRRCHRLPRRSRHPHPHPHPHRSRRRNRQHRSLRYTRPLRRTGAWRAAEAASCRGRTGQRRGCCPGRNREPGPAPGCAEGRTAAGTRRRAAAPCPLRSAPAAARFPCRQRPRARPGRDFARRSPRCPRRTRAPGRRVPREIPSAPEIPPAQEVRTGPGVPECPRSRCSQLFSSIHGRNHGCSCPSTLVAYVHGPARYSCAYVYADSLSYGTSGHCKALLCVRGHPLSRTKRTHPQRARAANTTARPTPSE